MSFSQLLIVATFVINKITMSEIDKEVKLLFIEEELNKHGKWLCDVFSEAIEKNKNIVTGNLLHSLSYEQFREKNTPGVRFTYLSYGRAFEIMGWKRNRKLYDTLSTIRGEKRNKMRRKPKNWYARNMYGGLSRLSSHILYGLSDAELERLKTIIAERKKLEI